MLRAGTDVIAARALFRYFDPVDLVPVGQPAQGVFEHLAVPIRGRALDIEAEQAVPERADNAGTRHRAAYRLARDYPECMITVVSQDGSVRYVGNPNGKVTYWDILSI